MDLQIFYRNNCTIINQIIHLKYLKKKKKGSKYFDYNLCQNLVNYRH